MQTNDRRILAVLKYKYSQFSQKVSAAASRVIVFRKCSVARSGRVFLKYAQGIRALSRLPWRYLSLESVFGPNRRLSPTRASP